MIVTSRSMEFKKYRLFIILPISLFSVHIIAKQYYPPIEIDSTALYNKINYLQSVQELKNQKHGPNIIVILADDLGKNDISLYDTTGVYSPHINSLANDGVVFTEALRTIHTQ